MLSPPTIRLAHVLGKVALGLLLGVFLLPALFELASLAGDVSPFKYQGF